MNILEHREHIDARGETSMASNIKIFLEGVASSANLTQTLSALNAASMLHEGQKRSGGGDYVEHPHRVALSLYYLGVTEDNVLATALLHDTIEDCNVDFHSLCSRFEITVDVAKDVEILSKYKGLQLDDYYAEIGKHRIPTLVKIADRMDNVQTMVGAFSVNKMQKYLDETEQYVIPLCKSGRRSFPAHAKQIMSMKNSLIGVCTAIRWAVEQIGANAGVLNRWHEF